MAKINDDEGISNKAIDDIFSGRLVVLDPKVAGNPTHVNINHIGEPQNYTYPVEEGFNPDRLQPGLDMVRKMQGYLSEPIDERLIDIPEVEVKMNGNFHKLDSFELDKRVFVKPVKEAGMYRTVFGNVDFDSGINAPFSFNIHYPKETRALREYSFNDGNCSVFRTPILWSSEQDKVGTHGSIALEVLCQQLEPVTSVRVFNGVIRKHKAGQYSPEVFNSIVNQRIYEEAQVALALTRSLLLRESKNLGITSDEIMDWNPKGIKEDGYKALKQVQEHGPFKIIGFYNVQSWNFDDFLDGSFNARVFEK